MQEAFDTLAPGKGMAYLFAIYAALCLFSLFFVFRYVPETKGKTLEQIEAELCPSDGQPPAKPPPADII